MPESPRWLGKRGRYEDARVALARTRGIPRDRIMTDPLVTRELEEIKSNVEYEKAFKGGWIDCFRPKNRILYRTLLGA